MFGEYKLLEKSDQILNGRHPGARKFWTVYSEANNVPLLDHLQEDLYTLTDCQYRVTFPTEPK